MIYTQGKELKENKMTALMFKLDTIRLQETFYSDHDKMLLSDKLLHEYYPKLKAHFNISCKLGVISVQLQTISHHIIPYHIISCNLLCDIKFDTRI